MTFAEYTPENAPINARPQCPECKTQKTQMYLARITPDEPGFDLRTFECPRCQHVETVVVEYKKTASVGGLFHSGT
jgi:rubredoxin